VRSSPDQARKPTAPTLRWLFQYFEGIDLLHIAQPDGTRITEILRLDTVHRLVLDGGWSACVWRWVHRVHTRSTLVVALLEQSAAQTPIQHP
jgi:hypothetical protein